MGGELVDWDLATRSGSRLARPGPPLPRDEADRVVKQLRTLADDAEGHVVDYTKLIPAGPAAPVIVVDRPAWIRANVAGLRAMSGPLLGKLEGKQTGKVSGAASRRISGVQVGGLLAYMSSKVLGQYEVFGDDTGENALPASGRLLLVAPNIAEVERRLDVPTRDFRLWVCLHEQTHRVQFTAVPWLRSHLQSELAAFADVTDIDPNALAARLRAAAGAIRHREGGGSIVELLQSPEQRVVLDRLQAIMTLLEGHADQVMDAVGPTVVPSVQTIRDRFERRRDGVSPIDRVVRRLLGLDLKMQQYRQGGAFVRAVVAQVGVSGFNTVWESPQTLPSRAELAAPEAWLTRVLGLTPAA